MLRAKLANKPKSSQMTVRYSPRAAKALGRLKTAYNDIEIFVEDTSTPNMWLELIRSILPSKVRLDSVNQLGGRAKVLEACKLDQRDDGRRKLYIIDGDFDFLLGRKKPSLKHLYRLRAYCVENLLISEEAAVYVGIPSKPELSERQLKNKFNHLSWVNQIEGSMGPLFQIYALAHDVAPSVKTTGFAVGNLVNNTNAGMTPCPKKIMKRILSVARDTMKHTTLTEFRRTRRDIKKRMLRLSSKEIVSGKDYLLPLFASRVRKKLSFQGSTEQMKVHLARAFVHSREPWLANRLSRICADL